MKSYIKAIILFDETGNKRIVPLKQGVNIITGESKTGKSALVEIIDYCLCSSRCTVPKGIITDFTSLYVLIMNIDDIDYIIARPESNHRTKMYFSQEKDGVDPAKLSFNYFCDKSKIDYNEAKRLIEDALGLHVSNTSTTSFEKQEKASLRNMVSYMFQHQNLMASKFALFYRFSDYQKRKDVIQQFPIFAGIVEQEYYSTLIHLNDLKAALKKAERQVQKNQTSSEVIMKRLLPLIKDYYALLGEPFDNTLKPKQLLSLALNLPEYDVSKLFSSTELAERYRGLEKELEDLRSRELDLLLKKQSLERANGRGYEYKKSLNTLREQFNISPVQDIDYVCPLCGHDCSELAEQDQKILHAMEWLDEEIRLTQKYTSDFSEDERKLIDKLAGLDTEIREVCRQLKRMESQYISSQTLKTRRQKAAEAKGRITVFTELQRDGVFADVTDDEISMINSEIKIYEDKIANFDVSTKIAEAQGFISQNMNRLSQGLDFEDEYYPIDLKFSLSNNEFDLYQYQKQGRYGEKIHLYEMGSGANWVSCHIVLFLSFLRYFATQSHSPMPLILFFDQPSQVYFPHGEDSATESDIKAVDDMYQTIFKEINDIGHDTGILPQIIIVDHVNGDGLSCKNEFQTYIRCNWRNGKGLI